MFHLFRCRRVTWIIKLWSVVSIRWIIWEVVVQELDITIMILRSFTKPLREILISHVRLGKLIDWARMRMVGLGAVGVLRSWSIWIWRRIGRWRGMPVRRVFKMLRSIMWDIKNGLPTPDTTNTKELLVVNSVEPNDSTLPKTWLEVLPYHLVQPPVSNNHPSLFLKYVPNPKLDQATSLQLLINQFCSKKVGKQVIETDLKITLKFTIKNSNKIILAFIRQINTIILSTARSYWLNNLLNEKMQIIPFQSLRELSVKKNKHLIVSYCQDRDLMKNLVWKEQMWEMSLDIQNEAVTWDNSATLHNSTVNKILMILWEIKSDLKNNDFYNKS